MNNERCKGCSGTGRTPDPLESLERILKAIDVLNPMDINVQAEDGVRWDDLTAVIRSYQRFGNIERSSRELIELIDKVGRDTEWKDADQTDRVFAWYEFDQLRIALGDLEQRYDGDKPDD